MLTVNPSRIEGACREVPKMSGILGNAIDEELMVTREMEKERIREEIKGLWLSFRRELEAEVIREMMMEGELEAKVAIDFLANAFDERELMVAREMEKKRIREEIRMSGLSGRWDLEAKVVMEMKMEGFFDRGSNILGFSLKDHGYPRVQGYGFMTRKQMLGENDGRMDVVKTKDGILLGAFPFQRDLEAVLKSRMPIPEPIKKAKPFPSANLSTKKLRKEWRCVLCQFDASSEHELNDHLRGRKHKAKEKAIAETTKPVNKNADNSDALEEIAEYSNQLRMNLAKPLDPCVSGEKRKAEALITEFVCEMPSVTLSKKVQKLSTCSLCQVTVTSEPEMKRHVQGRKHRAKEKAIAETTEPLTKTADNSESLVDQAECSNEQEMNGVNTVACGLKLNGELKNVNDCAEVSEQKINADDFEALVDQAEYSNEQEMNGVNLVPVEAKPLDPCVSGEKRKAEALITEFVCEMPSVTLSKKVQKLSTCSLCQVTVTSEPEMKRHVQGRKHRAKEKAIAETSEPLTKTADNSEPLVDQAECSNEQEMNGVNTVACGLKLNGELKNVNDCAEVSEQKINADHFEALVDQAEYSNEQEMNDVNLVPVD